MKEISQSPRFSVSIASKLRKRVCWKVQDGYPMSWLEPVVDSSCGVIVKEIPLPIAESWF